MKKKIVSLICFTLVTLSVLFFIQETLRDRTTTFAATYSETNNSTDVLIVGSSHVNNGYIPSMLWEENNMASVNAYSWSQPMWVSYHYIIEALKTQKPKYIVLEMFGATYGHSYIMPQEIDKTSYNNSFNLDPSINRLKLIYTSEFCGLDLRDWQEFLYLERYHNGWEHWDINNLKFNPHKQHDYLKGYNYMTESTPFEKPDVQWAEGISEPYEYCVEYLQKIVNLCNKKGIKLIFTMTPYIYGYEETGIFNWLSEYSNRNNIPFFNYCGPDGDRINFDYEADLCDNGHVNYNGAKKITQDLCDYLKSVEGDSYKKENNVAYNQLQEDYQKYTRVIKLNEVMVLSDMLDFFDACVDDKDITLFVNTNADSETGERFIQYMSEKGIKLVNGCGIIADSQLSTGELEYSYDLFGKQGTVAFDNNLSTIYINGTECPGKAESSVSMVLYDEVLDRPVISVWSFDNYSMSKREFTSDIMPNYR